jgi:hypothetical protein
MPVAQSRKEIAQRFGITEAEVVRIEREGLLIAAGVGQPVPAVHALAADDQVGAGGCDGFAEGLGCGREVTCVACLSVVVEDGEEEGPGVEIDAGIESGVGCRLEVAHEDLGGSE